MIVLDTSVLVYAVGREHPLRRPAEAVVGAATEGRIRATTMIEVVQEFAHVRARHYGRRNAVALARNYATLLAPLLVTEPGDLEAGLRLFARHEGLGAFDALLAAVAKRVEPTAFVSSDRGFRGVRSLRYVELGSLELDELL